MSFPEFTTMAAIKELFAEEVEAAGGLVTGTIETDTYFMARATLPQVLYVATGDEVQGGVALLAEPEGVCVHPYVLRKVCTNGAIMSQVVQTHQIVYSDCESMYETCSNVRLAIQECCVPDVFAGNVKYMSDARSASINLLIHLMPFLASMSGTAAQQFFDTIMSRFMKAGDRSRFGLMNAVTSVARDTSDPMLRWRLEELGGGIAVGKIPPAPIPGAAALAIPVG